MSAESPRKPVTSSGNIVLPQPVSDRSIIESVAGFINEVVPQGYSTLPSTETKEVINWARFEYADINDPAFYPDTTDDRSGTPPLLLVLGYGNGVQVWVVPASGEATEVLSWRQGVVRTLRILPSPEGTDHFLHKRPLVALCDSAGPGPHFCSLSFISLRCGDQVKSIKFKNPVSDVLANTRSVVVTFPERVAVFDAGTLEDRLTVTTCYPCPGPNPNPVALGPRWLAYAARRLRPGRRSSGGSEGDGVQSYTAAVLQAAKSLGKGLRGLGETVASSLSVQQRVGAGGLPSPGEGGLQPGVITIIDAQAQGSVRGCERDRSSVEESTSEMTIAHFTAHSEPVVAMAFDPSGMLLLTADRRGHDFHLFRIQPHPAGSSLTAVHHLYTLHRGDTTAKVQDIAFAADSRWVAVSTLRGTTHVFPITPYGGPVGTRTHATPHVVNRLSRFHRSAGLTGDATTTGRNSPVPEAVAAPPAPSVPYHNPRLPPYPHPTLVQPLAQVRQPVGIHPPSAPASPLPTGPQQQQGYGRNPPVRRAHSAPSDEGVPLRVTACFAPPRAWLAASPTTAREVPTKAGKRTVDSLFIISCHGSLVEYDLEPRHAAGIPKEKVCDDTPIELSVHAKAQWLLLRPSLSAEIPPPLPPENPLLALPERRLTPSAGNGATDGDEHWLSQVEIVTHAGPHRRLWMGPQFTFKTYNGTPGTPLSVLEMETTDVGSGLGSRPARSNPVNMPLSSGGTRPVVPVLIESGSSSSYEQSPRLMEVYGADGIDSDGSTGPGESQLREDLADAMMESPGVPIRETGRRMMVAIRSSPLGKRSSNPIEKVVNPVGTVITISLPDEEEVGADCDMASVQSSLPEDNSIIKWPTVVKPSTSESRLPTPVVGIVQQKSEQKKADTTSNGFQKYKEEALQNSLEENTGDVSNPHTGTWHPNDCVDGKQQNAANDFFNKKDNLFCQTGKGFENGQKKRKSKSVTLKQDNSLESISQFKENITSKKIYLQNRSEQQNITHFEVLNKKFEETVKTNRHSNLMEGCKPTLVHSEKHQKVCRNSDRTACNNFDDKVEAQNFKSKETKASHVEHFAEDGKEYYNCTISPEKRLGCSVLQRDKMESLGEAKIQQMDKEKKYPVDALCNTVLNSSLTQKSKDKQRKHKGSLCDASSLKIGTSREHLVKNILAHDNYTSCKPECIDLNSEIVKSSSFDYPEVCCNASYVETTQSSINNTENDSFDNDLREKCCAQDVSTMSKLPVTKLWSSVVSQTSRETQEVLSKDSHGAVIKSKTRATDLFPLKQMMCDSADFNSTCVNTETDKFDEKSHNLPETIRKGQQEIETSDCISDVTEQLLQNSTISSLQPGPSSTEDCSDDSKEFSELSSNNANQIPSTLDFPVESITESSVLCNEEEAINDTGSLTSQSVKKNKRTKKKRR